jgi:hypothetical protein
VVNGAEGVGQVVTGLVASGRSIYDALLSAVPGAVPLASTDEVALVQNRELAVAPDAVVNADQQDGDVRGPRLRPAP